MRRICQCSLHLAVFTHVIFFLVPQAVLIHKLINEALNYDGMEMWLNSGYEWKESWNELVVVIIIIII